MVDGLTGCAMIAGLLSLAMLLSRIRAPLGADEGYLWFGVQQLLRGQMPHRDFKSYEPGRYVWSAALARVFGPTLLVLRISTHLFFALGLFSTLLLLRELGLDWPSLVLAGSALTLWAEPQHKQFEHAWILFAWALSSLMLLHPSAATLVLSAAATGLALFFGFNLFVYFSGALGLSLIVAIVTGLFFPDLPMLLALAGGGLLGMLPFLVMLGSPGFASRFFRRRVASVLARGSSNLPLPMPWPWRPLPRHFSGIDKWRGRAFQLVFLSLFVVAAVAVTMIFVQPEWMKPVSPGILAAAALGLFMSHHAASRADAAHIAQSVGPLLLLAILLTHAAAPLSTALIAAVSLWIVWALQAAVQRRANPEGFCRRLVGGLYLDLPLDQARIFDRAEDLCGTRTDERAGFFAAPAYPALYASLSRDSPVYDTFCLYPADETTQQDMIDAIESAPVFAALVSDAPVDGREELRFSRTHPRVWAHLCKKFQGTRLAELGPDVVSFTDQSTLR